MTSRDKHFQKQRKIADDTDVRASRGFFNFMQRIENEMQKIMSVMSLANSEKILDLCMTFDEYSAAALKFNPRAFVSEVTLPENFEKHKLFVRNEFRNAIVRM